MAKRGNSVCRSKRRCILVAAFRRRCLAQLMQLATRRITVESTACDAPAEARQTPLSPAKVRMLALQMLEHRPQKIFGHFGLTLAVGVPESVAAGSYGSTNGRKGPALLMQPI